MKLTELDQKWLDATLDLIDANQRVRESTRAHRIATAKLIALLIFLPAILASLAFLPMLISPSVAL
jgi:hypothetical protein